jgi:hypothetical protein
MKVRLFINTGKDKVIQKKFLILYYISLFFIVYITIAFITVIIKVKINEMSFTVKVIVSIVFIDIFRLYINLLTVLFLITAYLFVLSNHYYFYKDVRSRRKSK